MVTVLFVLFYHKIFCVTFDETFARATGVKADRYNLLIAVITAVIIVLAMNLVGSLLISALVIFPALSAMENFPELFPGNCMCGSFIGDIRAHGNPCVDSGGNAGGFHHCCSRYRHVFPELCSWKGGGRRMSRRERKETAGIKRYKSLLFLAMLGMCWEPVAKRVRQSQRH